MRKVVGIFKCFNDSKNQYINSLLSELILSGIKKEEIIIVSENYFLNKDSVEIKTKKINSVKEINKNFDLIGNFYYLYEPKESYEDKLFISSIKKGSIFGGLIGFFIAFFFALATPNFLQLITSESFIIIFSCFITVIWIGIIIGIFFYIFKNDDQNNTLITIVYTNKFKEKDVKDIFKKYYSSNIKTFY